MRGRLPRTSAPDVCTATAALLSRRTGSNLNVLKAQLTACRTACAACADLLAAIERACARRTAGGHAPPAATWAVSCEW